MQRRWLVLAAVVAFGPVGAAFGQSMVDRLRHYHTPPGQEVRIGSHAHWDRRCRPTGAPNITVTQPPGHGSVATRPGTHIARESIGGAICNGREVAGTVVYYMPAAGFVGEDALTYTVPYGATVVTNTISIAVR